MLKQKRKLIVTDRNGRRRVASIAESIALRKIDYLYARLDRRATTIRNLERQVNDTVKSQEAAIKLVLEQKFLPRMLDTMAAKLGQALGTSELREVAGKIIAASKRPLPKGPLSLHVAYARELSTFRIEGEVPSFHYTITLDTWDPHPHPELSRPSSAIPNPDRAGVPNGKEENDHGRVGEIPAGPQG